MRDSDPKSNPKPGQDAPSTEAPGETEVAEQEAALEQAFFADEDGKGGGGAGAGDETGRRWKGAARLADAPGEPHRSALEEGLDDMEVEGEEELRRILGRHRSRRHPVLAAGVVLASLFGMWWLWEDVTYFFQPNEPMDLGKAAEAVRAGRLRHNSFVRLQGMPVPQSMASTRKGRTWFGSPVKKRTRYFLVRDTGHRLVVQLEQAKGQRVEVFPKLYGTFVGRLRRLDETRQGPGVRAYYLRQSMVSSGLRPFHEVTGQEILSHAGAQRATLRDIRGRRFDVRQNTLLEVFVAYPEDYELTVHTDLVHPKEGLIMQGGDGAPDCGPPVPFVPPTVAPPRSSAGQAASRRSPAKGRPAKPGSASPRAAPARTGTLRSARPRAAARSAVPKRAPAAGATLRRGKLRPAGWGGSVYLRYDSRVFTLDHINEKVVAPSGHGGQADGAPENGADRIVPIPPGTLVFAGARRDCARACRWRAPACRRACTEQAGVQILPVNGLFFVAAGGDCNGKGERTRINLQLRAIKTAERAEALVRSLGVPYVLTEDDIESTQAVHFVVRMSPQRAKKMMRQSGRGSPVTLSSRYEVIRVRWRELVRQGNQLVFRRTRRSFPVSYRRVSTPKGPRLKPKPLGPELRVASRRVLKAVISRPLELPPDAFLLEVGVRPRDMWFEPFVPGAPIFFGLLVVFALLNLWALVAYFRAR